MFVTWMIKRCGDARHRCSAEVHIGEGFLVLVDGAPGSVVLLLLRFLGGLLGGLSRHFSGNDETVCLLYFVIY